MGNNMVTAKVRIEGTRTILWNKFNEEMLSLEKQEKKGVAGNDPTEWERSYLATKEGQLYLEPISMFACCREGAKYTKRGRGSIMKMVVATLQVVDDRILLDRYLPKDVNRDPNELVYLDVRPVRNPRTRGTNMRYRLAASPGWEAVLHIMWDKTIVSRSEMEAVLIDAGRLCGVGDGRAIGLGRFEVMEFEIDAKEKTAA